MAKREKILAGWVAVSGDGNPEYYPRAKTAREAARLYVDDGEWGDVESTIWIHVHVWRRRVGSDGAETRVQEETRRIALRPPEPECSEDEHEWMETGPYGHGAGHIYVDQCAHCSLRKITDTYAADPEDGTQGHTSVRYERGEG